MEPQPDHLFAKWAAAECPFTIEYSPRALDDIRLAVTDAFFSLPRGGAEIGGLLLGLQERGRIAVVESLPFDCEHAFGPSFVLSDRDFTQLSELIAAAGRNADLRVVGWWHSHTRSEIFLSDADQKIHNRFFPEPWQVALVLKPHTFQPMRAGFFFREADGSIHATTSYHEFRVEPLPMRPAGAAPPPVSAAREVAQKETGARVIDVAAVTETAPPPGGPAGGPEPSRAEVAPPSFLAGADVEPRGGRGWIGWVAAIFGVAFAIGGYATRDRWLAPHQTSIRPAPVQTVGLNTIDRDGQLQIRWNGDAPPVQSAAAGSLLILDGGATMTIPLDRPHVQSGAYTYSRKSGRVDVTLTVSQPDGKETRVATLFSGSAPNLPAAAPAPAEGSVGRQELDAAREQNASLKADLARQVERNKTLEKALEELRKVIQREQQRKRLEVQSPDAAK